MHFDCFLKGLREAGGRAYLAFLASGIDEDKRASYLGLEGVKERVSGLNRDFVFCEEERMRLGTVSRILSKYDAKTEELTQMFENSIVGLNRQIQEMESEISYLRERESELAFETKEYKDSLAEKEKKLLEYESKFGRVSEAYIRFRVSPTWKMKWLGKKDLLKCIQEEFSDGAREEEIRIQREKALIELRRAMHGYPKIYPDFSFE